MGHFAIALLVFGCVFASALIGLYLSDLLPEHHLSEDSINVLKLATGVIATMAALVLGLLISSAKGSFDTVNRELVHNAARLIQLDRTLAQYGAESKEIRLLLKRDYSAVVHLLASGDATKEARLGDSDAVSRIDDLQRRIAGLSPRSELQTQLKVNAVKLADEVFATRWLVLLQKEGSVPMPLLVVLVAWLSLVFGTFGLFAPRNATIFAALVLCALSASGAIYLILEMDRPLDGAVNVSLVPLLDAVARLGQ